MSLALLSCRFRELRDWYMARSTVSNWLSTWLIATSREADRAAHTHDRVHGHERIHAVNFRNGLTLQFERDQWSSIRGLLAGYERYLQNCPSDFETGDVVIDIGAHVGSFIVPLCFNHPGVRAIAYEPDPTNFQLLETNASTNDLGPDRLVLHRQAVCGEMGLHGFLLGVTSTTGTMVAAGYIKNPSCPPKTSIFVQSVTLEEALAEAGSGVCRLVKMDCEGSEYNILETTKPSTIARIENLIVEAHPIPSRQPKLLFDMLNDFKFTVSVHRHTNGCWEYFCTRRK